jgi:hypothetical protein
LSPFENGRHYHQDNKFKKQKEGNNMYGLAEYALLRQQLNEEKRRAKHHHEFDFPITQPAPQERNRRIYKVATYLTRKSTMQRLFRLEKKV